MLMHPHVPSKIERHDPPNLIDITLKDTNQMTFARRTGQGPASHPTMHRQVETQGDWPNNAAEIITSAEIVIARFNVSRKSYWRRRVG
jgi:hypothetical protein